jgi:hypothetical protein
MQPDVVAEIRVALREIGMHGAASSLNAIDDHLR